MGFSPAAMEPKRSLLLVVVFAAIYYVARIAIFSAALSGNMNFEEEQSALVEDVVLYSFLAIGVGGLVFLVGVYLVKPWGFWGTVAVGSYTVAFDLWALIYVQASAGAGIVPAAIIIGFLIVTRDDFLAQR